MNPGGDAAEQVVRLSLEGVEVAAKISGNGAKNIALLLYATLKQEQKTKGKARLTSMLKSGKELKVYTITQKDVDVIARAEDASKIQRITERFRLATVDRADVSLNILKDKDKMFPKDKSVKEALQGGRPEGELEEMPDPERGLPPAYDEEPIEGRSIDDGPKKEELQVNPSLAKTGRDPLSEPSSTQADRSNGLPGKERPSVREKLNLYKAEIAKEKAERASELAKDVVSKGVDAAKDVVKAVPLPGRER